MLATKEMNEVAQEIGEYVQQAPRCVQVRVQQWLTHLREPVSSVFEPCALDMLPAA